MTKSRKAFKFLLPVAMLLALGLGWLWLAEPGGWTALLTGALVSACFILGVDHGHAWRRRG